MILTLLAVTLNDQPLSRPIKASFDANGGTIGRADHSTMALPDPERFISRKQAEVVFVNGGFLIRNVGAANPITVAGRTLTGGETATLADGDEVRIGGYQLRAQVAAAAELTPPPRVLQTVSLATAAPVPPKGPVPAAPRTPTAAPMVPPIAPSLAPSPAPSRAPSLAAPIAPPVFAPPVAPPMARPTGPRSEPPRRSDAPRAGSEAGANPFADLLGPAPMSADAGARTDNPFADLLSPSPAPPAPVAASTLPVASASPSDPFADLLPPPAGVDSRSAAVAAPPPPAARLPDDFDPFRTPVAPAPPPPSAAAADPFADLMPAASRPGVDADFGLGAAARADDDALARFVSDVGTPARGSAAASSVPVDPLELFGPGATESAGPSAFDAALGAARAPAPAPASRPQADNVSALNAAYVPPLRVASPLPPSPPAAARASAPTAAPVPGDDPAQALWSAFCEGAQVQLPLPAGSAAERMQMIGRILRSAVEGTLQLMAVRASTKHEMRAAVTQIQARSNNPLKFSPDGATGIEQLVQPPARGFLDGPAAMDDAMRDLVAHSIGTVAGMRAAIEGMLDRFDPTALEGKLGAGSMLDSLLPMNRKARLWELYLQHYRAIREEAQEDFHNLFGKAFVAAYEQQVERLKQRPRS